MSVQRSFDLSDIGDVTVVILMDIRLMDELDLDDWARRLYQFVEKEHRKKIVLNFANVESCSSTAMGKLVVLHKKAKQMQAEIRLCNVRPEIYEIFAITMLNKLLPVKDSVEAAVDSF